MSLLRRDTFDSDRVLPERKIERLGIPEKCQLSIGYARQREILHQMQNSLDGFDSTPLEEQIDRERDLFSTHEGDIYDESDDGGEEKAEDAIYRQMDGIFKKIEDFRSNMDEMKRLLLLYHTVAIGQALVWLPPLNNKGNIDLRKKIDTDAFKPFNYLIHTHRDKETHEIREKFNRFGDVVHDEYGQPVNSLTRNENAAIFSRETTEILEVRAAWVSDIDKYAFGQVSDLEEKHLKETIDKLKTQLEILEPYLHHQKIDTAPLEKMLGQIDSVYLEPSRDRRARF